MGPSRAAAVLALSLSALPAGAALRPAEDRANAALRFGVVTLDHLASAPGREPRAAAAALALALGDVDRARSLLEALPGRDGDCVLQSRLAELGVGTPCARVPPQPLATGNRADAARIVSRRAGESPGAFFAAVAVACLQAAGGSGEGAALQTTTDRFRVSGTVTLDGTWYLDDRLLVTVAGDRPAVDRSLERLARLRPEAVLGVAPSTEPRPAPRASGVGASAPADEVIPLLGRPLPDGSVSVLVPAGWSAWERDATDPTWWWARSPAPIEGGPGLLAVRAEDVPEARARRNPLARRKRPVAALAAPEALVAEIARIPPAALEVQRLADGTPVLRASVLATTPTPRTVLARSLRHGRRRIIAVMIVPPERPWTHAAADVLASLPSPPGS